MEKKSIQFILANQSVLSKEGKRKEMQVARATGRRRVNFRSFCERVGKSTSFTWQEVGAVLNFAIEIAKDIVSEGDIVEFGDLGTPLIQGLALLRIGGTLLWLIRTTSRSKGKQGLKQKPWL